MQDILQKSQELKEKGNKMFIEKHFEKAIEFYTQAIETLGVDKKECAPYLCNRAKCNIILDRFGAAI